MSKINLPENMKNFTYFIKEVGKTVKSSKIKHTWEVTLDGKHHVVELFDSRLSGKMKVMKDGTVIFFEEE